MKIRAGLLVGFLLLFTAMAFPSPSTPSQQWFALDGATRAVAPAITITDADPTLIRMNCSLSGILTEPVSSQSGDFTRLSVIDGGVSGEIGHPQLPAIRKLISIPYGAVPTLEVASVTAHHYAYSEIGITGQVCPVQAPVVKLPGAAENAPFNLDQTTYSANHYQHADFVQLGETGIIRGHRYVELIIYPVDVNPATHEAMVLANADIRIHLAGSDMALTQAKAERYGSFGYHTMADRLLTRTPMTQALDEINGMPEPPMLLIITDPAYATNANLLNYIAWKEDKGFRPLLVTTGTTGTTTTQIKAYLQNAYDTWPIPPTYVLLIGDVATMPTWTGIGADNPCTDLNYTMLEGTDYLPDLDLGRWSVTSATQLGNIIAKTMQYESVGWTGNSTWEKYCCFMASNDNYSVSEGTHNFVISNYLQPDGYSYDRLYCHTYSATPAQTTAAHNAGRSLSIYSGHGAETYWADGPVYYQSDVNALTNTVYPFVQSYACLTGQFTVAECFAETWIRAVHGAVGMMASSVTSYWTEDDILEKRVMEGFCANVTTGNENQTWTAGMMNYGKVRFYQYFGDVATTRRYFEMYNIHGDPSVDLWTAVPVTPTVTHAAALFVGATTFDVSVSGISDWALVCVHDENDQIYATGYLFANGTLTLSLGTGATTPGTLHVTVTGHDLHPYQATVPITVQNGPYIVTSAEQISDAAQGDNDGQWDFGETLDISLTEENLGNQAANSVNVSIACPDEYMNIMDGTETYGTLNAGQQLTIPYGFQVAIPANVPDGHVIHMDITAADNAAHEWNDFFTMTAHAPALQITSSIVNDASGNGNGVMDPGETVALALTLFNNGSAGASSLVGTLTTDYPYATIGQATGSLVTLNPAQSGSMSGFSVSISPSAPSMDRAIFYLDVTMAGGRTEHLMYELLIGGFSDMVENGLGNWTHQANQTGWADQWHVETIRSHSPTHSFKCGATGDSTTAYANHQDAVLVTPTILLTGHAELRFWHKMEGEISATYTDSAYDAGTLEISVNGGAWTQLTPGMGGYNKWTRCTAGGGNPYTGPFTCHTSCWSGSIPWTEVVCDLAAYSGSVQFRFRFGSDNGGGREGWYVDDIRVSLVVPNNAPQTLQGAVVGSAAHLTWNTPSSGALDATLNGYNVYRNGVKIDSLIRTLSYDDELTSLPFATYTYGITAQYSNGESGMSNTAPIVWSGAALDAVTDFTAISDGNDIVLRWSPITGATEYHVFTSDNPSDFSGAPIIVTGTTYTLTGEAANYLKRFYMIKAAR
jgi:hypothetical protein